MAVCGSRAGSGPFNFKLHTVLCIDQSLAVAVHGDVSHGAQIDPEAKLVGSEILGQRHVGPAVSGRFEVTGQFIIHVAAADALVVDPVGNAVDCNLHLGDVGVEVVFSVPGAGCVGVDAQQQDDLERPALGVTRRFSRVSEPRVMGTTLSRMTRSYANSLPVSYMLSTSSARVLLRMTSYSIWMFSSLYPSLLPSDPFTTWCAGARTSSKTKSLGRACG